MKLKTKKIGLDIENDIIELNNYDDNNSINSTNSISSNNSINSTNSKNNTDISNDINNLYFIQLCDNLINDINENAKKHKEQIRNLKNLFKKEIKNSIKYKKKNIKKKNTGFTTNEVVPKVLCDLINVEYGTKMPRTILTKKIYQILKDRNLYYEQDKRILRADDEIKKIFDLSDQVNNSTSCDDEHSFNFYNIQTYIAKCYQDN